MNAKKRTFLVDYENVNQHGLYGIHKLTAEDSVLVFYSSACPKIPMESLVSVNCPFSTTEVMPGKQALDIQLSSFLGHELAKHPDRQFIVVSGDSDFDKVLSFWRKRGYRNVRRSACISGRKRKASTEEPADASTPKVATATGIAVAGPDKATRKKIAKIVATHRGDENPLTLIHGDLVKEYGPEKGRELYLYAKSNY